MKHHFIINPAAGKGTLTESLAARIKAACESTAVEYVIYETKAPGDAEVYVREAIKEDGMHRFYACGGDGTLGETVNGAPTCDRAEFALIPIGTGNDFCRNFDYRAAFFDIERQLNGTPTPLDLIRYNDRYCVNMLNIGFDCNAANRANELKKKSLFPKSMAYAGGVASSLMRKMTTDMTVTLDGEEEIHRPLLLITIANGQFCGGGFRSNPKASPIDGLFDVNIIEKMSRFSFISLVGSYKAGTHIETAPDYVTYRQARTLTLSLPKNTAVCVDGEIEYAENLTVTLEKEAIRFILPEGVSLKKELWEKGVEEGEESPEVKTEAKDTEEKEEALDLV